MALHTLQPLQPPIEMGIWGSSIEHRMKDEGRRIDEAEDGGMTGGDGSLSPSEIEVELDGMMETIPLTD